jgi:acetoin utilization protein AcuC
MEVVPPLIRAYDPDVLVTQLGVDTLATDPLAGLNLTPKCFITLVEEIKSWNRKWVALGGGGYDVMNVARAWSQAWAVMKGADIPDVLPEAFAVEHRAELGRTATRSVPAWGREAAVADNARKLAASVVAGIKKNIFPILGT